MRSAKLIALTLVTISLLAVPLAWSQGGNPPASTKESGAGHGMTAVEQTGKSSGDVEQQITALSEQFGQAYLKGDTSLLEKYLADDYTAIRANGMLSTKAQEIENLKSGALKFESDDLREREIRAYGDTAVALGKCITAQCLGIDRPLRPA